MLCLDEEEQVGRAKGFPSRWFYSNLSAMESPPPPPPQQPTPPAPVVIPARDGLGCFAKGCLIVIVGGVLLCGALFVGGWYMLGRAVGSFTATQPADVRIENVSDSDLRSAEDKLNRLGQATASNQETTIEFTANELNAMIAREPLFA